MFTIIFGILIYLSSYIPLIFYQKFITEEIIDKDSFGIFVGLYAVVNFIAIFNFILNIFDVKVEDSKMPPAYLSADNDPE